MASAPPVLTSSYTGVGAPSFARAWLPRAVVAGLCLLAVATSAAYPGWPTYDSQYALMWGQELSEGKTPGFQDYRAPTPHPLLIGVGYLLSPLGTAAADRAFMAITALTFVALIVAIYRLGRISTGVIGGLVAAALLITRLDYGLLAAIGFLDIPYCALVAWAGVEAFERPRRDFRVLSLLTLAGLLRPEAWLLALAYAVWAGWGGGIRRRAALLAGAGAGALTWGAVDFAVTGDPLFSWHHTDALAAELSRSRPVSDLPLLMADFLAEIVKVPVLAMATVGAVLAVALRQRSLTLPAAVIGLTCLTYVVIAGGGLAAIPRYLLVAGLGIVLFAGYALTGWTTQRRGSALRRAWATVAALLVLTGAAYTVIRTDPSGVLGQLRQREELQRDLRAVLTSPAVEAARRCGPVTVPNHKLVPQVRAVLGSDSTAVAARSDRSRPPQTGGVALVVAPQFERLPAINVWEVPADGRASVIAPPSFERRVSNRHFAAWTACA